MKYKKLIRVFAALCLAGMLAGCDVFETASRLTTANPTSTETAVYSAGESVTGGDENISAVPDFAEILDAVEGVVLRLSFWDPERDASPNGVPAYTVTAIDGLSRLNITLKNTGLPETALLTADDWGGTLFTGAFAWQSGENELTFTLHTEPGCTYSVASDGRVLEITLHEPDREQTAGSRWYAVTRTSENGEFSASAVAALGVSPILCGDCETILLVSEPFETQEAAESWIETHADALDKLSPGRKACAVELSDVGLPDPATGLDQGETGVAYLTKDGSSADVELFLENGHFLTWCPEEGSYLYARTDVVPGVEDRGDYYYETLYSADAEGNRVELLPGLEFSYISEAAYSADGRYLAFLDYMDIRRCLAVYDTETGTLTDGEALGFGYDTATFAWDDTDSVLYGITGDGTTYALQAVQIEDGVVKDAWAYTDLPMEDGPLCCRNGCLYFIDPDENGESWVWALDIRTNGITLMTEGYSFAMHADTGRLAVLSYDNEEETATTTCLKVIELDSSTIWMAAEHSDVVSVVWDEGGDDLICQSFGNDDDENYPMGMYVYSMEQHSFTEGMRTVSGFLDSDETSGTVLMNVLDAEQQDPYYRVYRLTWPKD